MTRKICVVYLLPVYATVNLDADKDEEGYYPDSAVTRVWAGTDGIFASDDHLQYAIEDPAHAVEPQDLSDEDKEKAIAIAESTVWPSWESS